MLEISILKIQDPGCFWGRIVHGVGIEVQSPEEYESLHVRMNLFYHDVNLDVQKIRPPSLKEHQVCVVYSPTLKSWCRAVVESVFMGTAGCQVMCFLVDHAEHVLVSSDSVRAPLEKFLQLPFWVKKFQLAGICPMRLQVPVYQKKAKLVPSTYWDSSATRYLHSLVQASSLIEAVLCEVLEDSTAIELYLTIRNVKICVNDDLVTKKFACFSSTNSGSSPGDCGDDPIPVVLGCDLSKASDFVMQNGYVSKTLRFNISPRNDLLKSSLEGSQVMADSAEGATLVLPQETPQAKPLSPDTDTGTPTQSAVGGGDGGSASGASDCCEEFLTGAVSDGSQADGSQQALETETLTSLADEFLDRLNLFRFMKFLNPFSKYKMEVPQCSGVLGQNSDSEEKAEVESVKSIPEEECEPQEMGTVEPTVDVSAAPTAGQVRVLVEEMEEEEATAITDSLDAEVELDCARLLQLLNPDPLKTDSECLEMDNTAEPDSVSPIISFEPCKNGILVHTAIAVDPCTSLRCSPLTDNIRKTLLKKGYSKLRPAEWYCWPAVARGCDTLLISGCGAEPLTYIPPLLSHLRLVSACSTLTSRTGPIAVILCHGWEKAQCVFDILEDMPAAESLHPMMILVGEKDEAQSVKIQRNCQVLVTTPYSLSRLLGLHCFLLLRLCHLVLDEVDVLFSKAPEQMAAALQHFQKAAASEERSSCCKQIVAVGQQWSREVEGLVRGYMSDPSIIITTMEEAALYGGVHQMVLLCLDCTKVSVLLGTLDFIPEVAQKTLIVTNTIEEVEHVFQAVNNTAAFCLNVHEGLTYQFDFIIEQWRKPIGPGTHVILVMTNDCMKALGIRDATCVVHYGFPSSPRLFGSRLCCMSDNFQNLSDKDCGRPSCVPKSVLLLSERDARHVTGVLRYLERSGAALPPELLLFAQGVQRAREEQKADRPLCDYLKSFGFCRDSRVCPDRHHMNTEQDAPQHPESGNVMVAPLYIKNASCYYGRIVTSNEDAYGSLAAEMLEYYAIEKFNAKEVVKGEIYALLEEGVYRRVQALEAPERGERLFCSVKVLFLDEGREQEVKAHQLLTLPSRLRSLRPQALEMIVCRAKPIDGEVDWNPKVTRCISQKIKGVVHHARIVLSLGNTVWLDPMVRITRVPGLKTCINDYNVRSEILSTGMGTSNPEHLELLRALCRETSATPAATERSHNMQLEASEEALESGMNISAEALVNDIGVCADGLQSGQEQPNDPPESKCGAPVPPSGSGPEGASGTGAGVGICLRLSPSALSSSVQNGPHSVSGPLAGELGASDTPEENWVHGSELNIGSGCSSGAPPVACPAEEGVTRLHPHIKWFERDDFVTLNIKLLNPAEQSCEFFSDRVVYSARVDDRHYHAELELNGRIVADESTWEVKCNEPLVRLIKEQRGLWNSLLKHKSPFISFDFDHFEGDEPVMEDMEHCPVDKQGGWFVEFTGEEGCYVRSDTESDSD